MAVGACPQITGSDAIREAVVFDERENKLAWKKVNRQAERNDAAELAGFSMRPIGRISSPYQNASEIPKGLGTKHQAEGSLVIVPEFEDGLKDIEGFSHLIVIWVFDRSKSYELVGTPPSDDRPHGVFATRSPRRPNPIGLTVVQLIERNGAHLRVRGIDMIDGTPILDIKPYLSNVPPEQLRRGWLEEAESRARASS